ncbi:MAG: hypothetical protein VYD19_00525 [Myxococcota bacterium]|nr:hypothetical protein [Myxococcota bacterium]
MAKIEKVLRSSSVGICSATAALVKCLAIPAPLPCAMNWGGREKCRLKERG